MRFFKKTINKSETNLKTVSKQNNIWRCFYICFKYKLCIHLTHIIWIEFNFPYISPRIILFSHY